MYVSNKKLKSNLYQNRINHKTYVRIVSMITLNWQVFIFISMHAYICVCKFYLSKYVSNAYLSSPLYVSKYESRMYLQYVSKLYISKCVSKLYLSKYVSNVYSLYLSRIRSSKYVSKFFLLWYVSMLYLCIYVSKFYLSKYCMYPNMCRNSTYPNFVCIQICVRIVRVGWLRLVGSLKS